MIFFLIWIKMNKQNIIFYIFIIYYVFNLMYFNITMNITECCVHIYSAGLFQIFPKELKSGYDHYILF